MSKTEDIIQKIEYFQEGTDSAHKILEIIDKPETAIDDILEILEFDIAATANLLKLCNSTQYTTNGKINSVKEAIERLGLPQIKKLISMTASTNLFSSGPGHGYEAGMGEMRRHSIAAAVISKHLLHFAPADIKGDLFTTCLLHDIGKLLLTDIVEEHYRKIDRLVTQKGVDFSEAEKEVIGIPHAEVGARILEKWDFPPEMVTAVRFHHDPISVPDSPLTHFTALADRLAMLMGYTTLMDGLDYKGFPAIYKKYKLKESHLELVSLNAIDEIKSVIPFERRKKPDDEGDWNGIERRKDKEEQ